MKVERALSEVRLCPRNAQCRYDLACAYEEENELRKAFAEVRMAVNLVKSYGRAWKALVRIQAAMDAADIKYDDDDEKYLVVLAQDDEERPIFESDEECKNFAADCKLAGNELFVTKKFSQAVESYTKAIDALRARDLEVDSKLLSNRAAAFLQLNEKVKAASDARASTEADPDWWKGHWYLAQAVLGIAKSSPQGACTANAERAQEAKRALESCLKTSTLPSDKRPTVERLRDSTNNTILEFSQQEGCSLQ
mmetsp:Transcript_16556/g.21569  ORF Transcript_16556/g.21569 Transcript_16556/m.21569 type:complete len:252 (+) Transcript_16556:149-904(+)|eukprot:CAMPEP_0197316732 /NCGR_PEP_ID=MMETSP0891-20130614/43880_1 /TAXON_ID=44058 ORGANISM="Aureoumbra lagunensis, Strain CCMP1510" /NCGR_SAMPLE_ID=MMETSP0891 /ASSEMBLY_ACC=CAM_ASM_000534 /LENGTH=251 /DNA_ID=CAMNT_0042806347 /DNA_START=157 /DNA_END=912 /DNA_ORIENTATION=+